MQDGGTTLMPGKQVTSPQSQALSNALHTCFDLACHRTHASAHSTRVNASAVQSYVLTEVAVPRLDATRLWVGGSGAAVALASPPPPSSRDRMVALDVSSSACFAAICAFSCSHTCGSGSTAAETSSSNYHILVHQGTNETSKDLPCLCRAVAHDLF